MNIFEEPTNENRASNIDRLLLASDYEYCRDGLVDLITDCLHYALTNDYDPQKVLESATDHFEHETGNVLSILFPNENDPQFFTVILTVSYHLRDDHDSPAWTWEGTAEDQHKAISRARKAACEAFFTDDPDDFPVHAVGMGSLAFIESPDENEHASSAR